jgi:hypothetical protein
VELGGDELTDMWGSGPNDVWAVGWNPPPEGGSCEGCDEAMGVAWHWNGKQWRRVYAEAREGDVIVTMSSGSFEGMPRRVLDALPG